MTDLNGCYSDFTRIGSGGFGSVYRAYHNILCQDRAIKILRPGNDNERFKREALSVAALAHPNIVQIHDAGEDWFNGQEVLYIAMEYVPGGTLRDLIQEKGPLPDSEAVRLTLQVAEALQQAHDQGVIHRDIKPQNILLTNSKDVKLVDFGIAHVVFLTTITRVNPGTPLYMSPEQVRNSKVDGRSDLYSLGVVLYEMVTGELPFVADTERELARKQRNEQFRPPIEVNPEVREKLNAVCVKLLKADRRERYSDAAELITELNRYPEEVVVPNLIGMTPDQARGEIAARDLRPHVHQQQRVRSETVLEGRVAEQSPEPGTEVKSGRRVEVWVSLGPPPVEVPYLIGQKPRRARRMLRAAGLQLGDQRIVQRRDEPKGTIIEQEPEAWEEVDPGSLVNVTVSLRPPPDGILRWLLVLMAAVVFVVWWTIRPPTVTIESASLAQTESKSIENAIELAMESRTTWPWDVNIEYDQAGQEEGAQCVQNALEAAQNREIVVWIGPYGFDCAAAQIPILNREGLAMISPSVTYIGFTKPSPEPDEPYKYFSSTGERNFSRVIPTDDEQASAGAVWMDNLGVESVFIINDREAYGTSLADEFEGEASELGIEVVGREGIDGSSSDYSSLMSTVAERDPDPDAIYFAGTIENNADQLLRDKIAAGMSNEDVIFMGPDAIHKETFLQEAGGETEDIYVTSSALHPSQLPHKGQEEFVEDYRKEFGSYPESAYAAYAYEATKVMLDAIEQAYEEDGEVTRENVRREVFATEDYRGVLGTWSFDRDGDTTLTKLSVQRVENGEFVPECVIDVEDGECQ